MTDELLSKFKVDHSRVPWSIRKKVSSYIAQYPVLGTAQSALHTSPLADLFILDFSGKHSAMLHLLREDYLFKYPPLSVARDSFTQLSELRQRRGEQTCQSFETATRRFEPRFSRKQTSEVGCGVGCSVWGWVLSSIPFTIDRTLFQSHVYKILHNEKTS